METAGQELEELREMKEDVERRERAQATVIENQAKRLDELETLYKVCTLSYPLLTKAGHIDRTAATMLSLKSLCCWIQQSNHWSTDQTGLYC